MNNIKNNQTLHPAQLEVYYDQVMDLESPHYNVGGYVLLEGQMDKEKMLLAIKTLQEVYDIHKLTINFDNKEPSCTFKEKHFNVPIKQLDFSDTKEPLVMAKTWMKNQYNIAFSLEKEPLYDFAILDLGENTNILFCKYHHILTDAYGFTVVLKYVAQKYSDLVNGIEDRKTEYKQYEEEIAKANNYLSSEKYEKNKAYWLNKFETLPSPILTKKYNTKGQSHTLVYNISEKRREHYNTLNKTLGTSLQHLTIAALHIYYGKIMQDDCSSFGVSVYKRRKDQWKTLGMFAGILPYKSDYDGSVTIKELIGKITKQLFKDYRHQNYPVSHLNRELNLLKNNQVQLFEIIINYLLLDFDLNFVGLKSTTCDLLSDAEKVPLRFWWRDYGKQQALELRVDHSLEYIKATDVELIVERVLQILDNLFDYIDKPLEEINILKPEEEKKLETFNNTTTSYAKEKTLINLFEEQVDKTPNKTAVIFEDKKMTYAELNKQASRLAQYLIDNNIQKEELVIVCMDYSPEVVVSILGILKAGAAYVPIDPTYPQNRINYLVEDTKATFVLTDESNEAHFNQKDIHKIIVEKEKDSFPKAPSTKIESTVSPENLAYVIYTSGTTGKPKGVMIQHNNLVNYLTYSQNTYGKSIDCFNFPLFTSLSFDLTQTSLLLTLLSGGTLTVLDNKDIDTTLANIMTSTDINIIKITPSHVNLLDPTITTNISKAIVGGEKLERSHIERLKKLNPDFTVFNEYGPTEATIGCSVLEINSTDDYINIGKPISNAQIFILNKNQNVVPIGVVGELCIGGDGVARGYLNKEELSKQKFIQNPFDNNEGSKLYKTGDLACWLEDGTIDYLGRKDDQVKVRGYRIELGEVESVLLDSALIKAGAVLAKKDKNGNNHLIAYIASNKTNNKGEVYAYLKAHLPSYMVPSQIVELSELSLTTNGKINRRALPNPMDEPLTDGELVGAQNQLQTDLIDIWKKLLNVNNVGINNNFFELGGDSIITIQLVRKLKQKNYHLLPKDVFENPTIAALSKVIKTKSNTIVAEQGDLEGTSPLLPIQEWFLEKENDSISHFNQAVLLEIDKAITPETLDQVIEAIIKQHDSLRFSYAQEDGKWIQSYTNESTSLIVEEINNDSSEVITAICDKYQASLDIEKGDFIKTVFIKTPGNKNRLFIAIHHLAIDGISWRILLDHLNRGVVAIQNGEAINLGAKTTSYRTWAETLQVYATSEKITDQVSYWKNVISNSQTLPVDKSATSCQMKDVKECLISLDKKATDQLLKNVNQSYNIQIDDLLLSALGQTITNWSNNTRLNIGLEGHGREYISDKIDTSNTIGWYTSLYPITLEIEKNSSSAHLIKSVKEQLRSIPDKGLGFGLLRYMHPSADIRQLLTTDDPELVFNYLGQIDNSFEEQSWLRMATESVGKNRGDLCPFSNKMEINCFIKDGELSLMWNYSTKHYNEKTINQLAQQFISNLSNLIEHCVAIKETEATPSDYGLAPQVSYQELETFFNTQDNGELRKDKISALYPLSPMQEGILFHALYDTSSTAFTEQFTFDFPEGVNVNMFKLAWEEVIKNHSILRTSFIVDEFRVPVQCVNKNVDLPFEVLDYSSLSDEKQASELAVFLDTDYQKGFQFNEAPLMRITMIKLDDKAYKMVWTHQHILLDGWSTMVMMREILYTYEDLLNGNSIAAKDEDHFEDYIKYLIAQDSYKEEKFWKTYMTDLETSSLLPFISNVQDRNKAQGKSKELSLDIGADLTTRIKEFAQQNKLTVNTIVQGVWAFLLSKYTGNQDVSFGVAVSGRPSDLRGVEEGVGLYMNTIPLYAKITENEAIVDCLSSIQNGHADAREFQYTSLNNIQNWIGIKGDFFDSILVFDNYPMGELMSRDWMLKVENIEVKADNNFMLSIDVIIQENLIFNFSYYEEQLSTYYAEMIKTHFEQVLTELVRNKKTTVSDIKFITNKEINQLLDEFNDTVAPYEKYKTVTELFLEQAANTPDKIALVFEGTEWTYAELDKQSTYLANHLKKTYDIKANDLIGVMMDRSAWAVISILGILKAGAGYVPIDIDYPIDRKSFIIEDTKVKALIIQSESLFDVIDFNINIFSIDIEFDEIEKDDTLSFSAKSSDLAYVIYTSGSTGKPKGVMIQHDNLLNYLTYSNNTYKQELPYFSFPLFTSLAFDLTQTSILLTLTTGGTLSIENGKEIDLVLERITNNKQVNILKLTPAHVNLLESIEETHITKAIVGGEKLERQHVEQLKRINPSFSIFNEYGPTETTIGCTVLEINSTEDFISIGKPIYNTQIHIVDANQKLLPVGVVGELCISGDGVARGYLNRKDLTNQKFVDDPYGETTDAKMYKTGDLARWMEDGNLEYLGRKDDQVKIRGYRIELGEIESALQEVDVVDKGVVLAKEDTNGNKRLVAYVVPKDNFDKEAITRELSKKLPTYMVPSLLLELEKLPLTTNGKIDKKALPDPNEMVLQDTEYVAPENSIQDQLALIWQSLLSKEKVGINDNFFELGGDSIITIQVVSRAKRLGYQLLPKDIFENPTIAALSKVVKSKTKKIVANQKSLKGNATLLPIQKWFFEKENSAMSHFNQAVLLEIDKAVDTTTLDKAIKAIVKQHDSLRFSYTKKGEEWIQSYQAKEGKLDVKDITTCLATEESSAITSICKEYQASLNIENGELIKVVLIKTPSENNRLFIAIHHLAIDGVSWRILLDHLNRAIDTLNKEEKIDLGLKSSSYRIWGESLAKYATTKKVVDQLAHWQAVVNNNKTLPTDKDNVSSKMKDVKEFKITLDESFTNLLLQDVNQTYNTQINDILLSALGQTIRNWTDQEKIVIGLDGHGREDLFPEIDTSTTVGWFTNLYPICLELTKEDELDSLIKSVKEQLKKVPQKGMGYGLLRYMHPSEEIRDSLTVNDWDIVFNYLGQIDNILDEGTWFTPAKESIGNSKGEAYPFSNKLLVDGYVAENQLTLSWSYSLDQYNEGTIEEIAQQYVENLKQLISHCVQKETEERTPSDYGLASLVSYQELEQFLDETDDNDTQRKDTISDLYQLTPMQEGILFHSLYDESSKAYTEQFTFDFPEGLDEKAFKDAWQYIVKTHDILRTSFFYDQLSIPVQVVNNKGNLPIEIVDYSTLTEEEEAKAIQEFLEEDYKKSFSFSEAPLMRVSLLKRKGKSYKMVWTFHHILLDGWSTSVLMGELLNMYEKFVKNTVHAEKTVDNYSNYIKYINAIDKYEEEQFWSNYINGFSTPTLVPFVGNVLGRNQGGKTLSEIHLDFDENFTEEIKQFAKSNQLTVNTLMQGVWSFLLSKYTSTNDTIFGVTVSGRPSDLQSAEYGVGLYINTIALRSVYEDSQQIVDWLLDIQKGHTEAREYQYTSLSDVQKYTGINGDIFDSILVFENYPIGELLSKEWLLKVDNINIKEQTNYLLSIIVNLGESLNLNFNYNDSLLTKEYVEMIKGHFKEVLCQIVKEQKVTMSEIDILTSQEKQQLLEEFNTTVTENTYEESIITLFEEQVAKTPEKIALVFEDRAFTYQELNERSNEFAHFLKDNYEIETNDLAGIVLKQNEWLVVAILATLKLGVAYVPIDISNPKDRVDYLLNDSSCKVTIDASKIEKFEQNKQDYSKENPQRVTANNLLAVIYTSGSTNNPKGVSITQTNLLNRLHWMWDKYPFVQNEVGSMKTSIGFVDHLWELFGSLLRGIKLVQFDKMTLLDLDKFINKLEEHKVTRIVLVPSLLKVMLEKKEACKTKLKRLKYWTCSGEVLPMTIVEDFYKTFNNHKLFNIYGSTEVTADATIFDTSIWYDKQQDQIKQTKLFAYNLEESLSDALLNSGEIDPFSRRNEIYLDLEQYKDVSLSKTQSIEEYKDFLKYNLAPNIVNVSSSKFIGHMTAPMPKILNDLHNCVNLMNQNLVKYETSGIGTFLERQVLGSFHKLLFNSSSDFYDKYTLNHEYAFGNITSGGTMSNVTALAYALSKKMGDINIEEGINKVGLVKSLEKKNFKDIAIIGSSYCHYSMKKALKLLGIGTNSFVQFDLDKTNLKTSKKELTQLIKRLQEKNILVLALIGVAGTTEAGSIDPLNDLAEVAAQNNVHYHVDGAFGGAYIFSDKLRPKLKGIERADTVTLCGHKQLYLHVGTSLCIFKDPEFVKHSEINTYYQARKGSVDLGKYTIEGSRPFSALVLHGALNIVGKEGYSEILENNYDNAQYFSQLIKDKEGFELYLKPDLNIILYRYIPKYLRSKLAKGELSIAEETEINELNEALQKKQFEKGDSFVSYTKLVKDKKTMYGIVWLRSVLMNPYTTKENLKEILEEQVELIKVLQNKTRKIRSSSERRVPIGKSIANVQTYILDKSLNLCPIGVVGEICIGGAGITDGYINDSSDTSDKFIENPFRKGERIYRMGDLGKWLSDGNIEYMGRVDDQVKIRGHRVELGEIESVILQIPSVDQCVVLMKESNNAKRKSLVAYVVSKDFFNKKEIESFVKSQLPDYMFPSVIVELEKMPLTTNGKIDKIKLKKLDISNLVEVESTKPRNEREQILVQIWKTLLDTKQVGIYDNFFDLGGHSLLATRMLSAIKKHFQVTVPISVLFQFTCIADLSEYMEVMSAVDTSEKNVDVQVIEL